MSNNGSIWSENIADKISAVLLPKLEKKTTYNSLLEQNLAEGKKVQKIGQYMSPEGFLIRVEEKEGKLIWREANNTPYQILEEDNNKFAADFNPNIKIRFFEDKVVEFYPSRKTITYKRHDFVKKWKDSRVKFCQYINLKVGVIGQVDGRIWAD